MRCVAIALLLMVGVSAVAADAPASQPANGKLPFVQVDVKNKQVRVACEACSENMDVGLEFFCVAAGTNEYESVLRTRAKASHLHLGLLMIGLEPGEPVHYSEGAKKWLPPHGPPLQISCQWKDPKTGQEMIVSAWRLMRSIKEKKKILPPANWIFAGSKIMEDSKYAADSVGYLVSVLNNELTVVDIPDLASRDLESRQLERNSDVLPPTGTEITMIVEPAATGAGDVKNDAPNRLPATAPKVDATTPEADFGPTIVSVDAGGGVKLDGMTVPVERLKGAIGQRRVKSKINVDVDRSAPQDVVQQVVNAIDLPPELVAKIAKVNGYDLAAPSSAPTTMLQIAIDADTRLSVDGQPVELAAFPEKLTQVVPANGGALAHLKVNFAARRDVVAKVTDLLRVANVQIAADGTSDVTGVSIDEAKIKALRQRWEQVVAPKTAALREAAQAHFEVIEALRREQQRLIDEADRIQRVIDDLQKEYNAITTPAPGTEPKP